VYRHLGKGPHIETIGLDRDIIVALYHPIRVEDLRRTTDFSCEELHQLYEFLQNKIDYINSKPELISHEDTEIHTARSGTFVDLEFHLFQMLGSFDPHFYEAEIRGPYGSEPIYGMKPKVRRVCIGNGIGKAIDDVFLPDRGGEYRIFHPLLPEDVRVAFGQLELQVQILAVLQLITALQRRSFAQSLCNDEDSSLFPLSSSRLDSIASLWEVCQDLSKAIAEQEVSRHIVENIDAVAIGGWSSHGQRADEDLFMLPRSKDLGFNLEGVKILVEPAARPISPPASGISTPTNYQSLDGSVHALRSRASSPLEAFPMYSEEAQLQPTNVDPMEEAIGSGSVLALDESQDVDQPRCSTNVGPVPWMSITIEVAEEPSKDSHITSTDQTPPSQDKEQSPSDDGANSKRGRLKRKSKSFSSIRKLFRKNHGKKEQVRDMPRFANGEPSQRSLETNMIDDTLNLGCQRSDGVHVPASTIAEPVATVADDETSTATEYGRTLKSQDQLRPTRAPPSVPSTLQQDLPSLIVAKPEASSISTIDDVQGYVPAINAQANNVQISDHDREYGLSDRQRIGVYFNPLQQHPIKLDEG
jgi:hypothetical protein